jgi:hypothetical protein
MTLPLLIGVVSVVAITAIYFVWVRKLPAEQPKQP